MAKRDANEIERGKSKLSEQMEKLRAAQEQVNMLRRLVSKSPGSLERRQATERESTPVRSGGTSRPSSSRVAVQSPMRFAGAPVNAPINVAPINVAPINVHPVKPVMTLDDLPFAIRYSQLLDDDAVIGLFFRNFFNNFQYSPRQSEISFESPFEMLSKMEAVCQNNHLRSLLGRLSSVRDESELDVLCNVALCAVEEASASDIEAPPNEEESLFSEPDPLNETDPNLQGSQDNEEDQEPSGTESDNSVIVQDDGFVSGSDAEHEENSVESVLYHPETPEDDRTDELPAEVSNEFVQSFAERYEAELIDNEFLIKNLDLAIVSQMDKHGPNAEFTPEITNEIIQEMQQFDEAKLGNLRGALTSLLVPFHRSSMVKTKDQILRVFSECLYDALVQSRIAQNASFDAEEGDGGDPNTAQDKQ